MAMHSVDPTMRGNGDNFYWEKNYPPKAKEGATADMSASGEDNTVPTQSASIWE